LFAAASSKAAAASVVSGSTKSSRATAGANVNVSMAGPKEHAEAGDRQKGIPPPPVHLASFSDDLINVKIGIFDDFFNDADPEIVESCSIAVEHLESLGAQVVKFSMPHMEEAKMAHD
jgi:Asp-tRNA(Asn)/Glu-tRNA(Gln) amidotransferase A subunit family amidase